MACRRQIDRSRVRRRRGDCCRPPPPSASCRIGRLAFLNLPHPDRRRHRSDHLGGSRQNLRGDISADAKGWNLDRFEIRAPGFTQVRLSGHLAFGATGTAFTGPVEIEAVDPKALAAWLEGRGETVQSELRPLSLRGEVTLGSEKIAVERLKAEFDRKPIAGRLVYVFAAANKSAKLDAELNASELDIDAALGFGNALLAGSDIARPHDMTIARDIGRPAPAPSRTASVRLRSMATAIRSTGWRLSISAAPPFRRAAASSTPRRRRGAACASISMHRI